MGIQDCRFGDRSDQDCWIESANRHVSDSDVYMSLYDYRINLYYTQNLAESLGLELVFSQNKDTLYWA